MSTRPDWDEYFMQIAEVAALRSNCCRRHVAAVIVKDRRIISTGYNGTPRGIRNCDEGGCPRCNSSTPSGHNLSECLCSHAEENSIVQAAYHGIAVKGATIYTTFSPCLQCAKMIVNSGIVEVVYQDRYSIDDVSMRLLKDAGVTIRSLKKESASGAKLIPAGESIHSHDHCNDTASETKKGLVPPLRKLMTLDEAIRFRGELRRNGKRLVATNGCFDLLHRGHAEYLFESRMLGDALLLLVNSDNSVRSLKGPSRPVVAENDRAFLLSSLEAVDMVVIFDGQRCDHELRLLAPDIYVKGGDYTVDTLDPAELAALRANDTEIVFKPFINGFSTTELIRRINAAGK